MRDSLRDRALGRWPPILIQLGIAPNFLRKLNGPCPMCAGKDRWRFTDLNGTGSWWCNNCGHGAGVDLVMMFKNCNYVEAVKLIAGVIGGAPLSVKRDESTADVTEQKNAMLKMWLGSLELNGTDIASRYFKGRGIVMKEWPKCIRWRPEQPYWLDRDLVGYFPVMLAKFEAPDNRSSNLQRTYLREPGFKAELPGAARKMMAGPIPVGGAVRLGPPAEVMGVAEGVETAFAASILNEGMTVWSALSTSGILRFQPPEACKKLIIFCDRDENFAGQMVGFTLGNRLRTRSAKDGPQIDCEVRPAPSGIDDQPWLANKKDWNDVLSAMRPRQGAMT